MAMTLRNLACLFLRNPNHFIKQEFNALTIVAFSPA
jgi:hypothetical protein